MTDVKGLENTMAEKGRWKEQAFMDQLSRERDFNEQTPVSFRYAICCGHRTGSNLLGEALYNSGLAGDPMEYYNKRLLEHYAINGKIDGIRFAEYRAEMEQRRTSPNGVFGINVKFDQLRMCFQNNWNYARRMMSEQDYVVFLYRKDKVRQAISIYIGQMRDLFNVPADVSDAEVKKLVEDVPFNPFRIASALNNLLDIEFRWRKFFLNNNIQYDAIAYEDFVADYDGNLGHILGQCGVPSTDRVIPEQPLKKVSNDKNEEFRSRFLEFIGGELDIHVDDEVFKQI